LFTTKELFPFQPAYFESEGMASVQPDAQWFGTTLVVEHRYAWGLAQGMKDAGLVLK